MTTSGPEGPMINRRNVVKDDHVSVPVTHEQDEAMSLDDVDKIRGGFPSRPIASSRTIAEIGRIVRNPIASLRVLTDAELRLATEIASRRTGNTSDADEQAEHDEILADLNDEAIRRQNDRWVAAPLPEDWPQADLNQPLADAQNAARRLAEPSGLLLADGTYATTDQLLIALGRSVRTDTERAASRADVYRLAGWQDRLREAAKVNFPPVVDTPAAETLHVAGFDQAQRKAERLAVHLAAESEFDQAKAVRIEVLDDVIMNMRSLSLNFDPEAEKMTKRQMADHIVQIAHDVQRVAEVVRGTL